jgi:hypothetical protein
MCKVRCASGVLVATVVQFDVARCGFVCDRMFVRQRVWALKCVLKVGGRVRGNVEAQETGERQGVGD